MYMSDARPNLGLRLTIALLALLAAGKPIFYDTLDPDCFWHLRVAEQIEHDGIGPLIDHISFASSKTPWTPYSWLAELGMKSLWDVGGYRAAIAMQSLMMGVFVILIALCASEGLHLLLPLPPGEGRGEGMSNIETPSSSTPPHPNPLPEGEGNPCAIILATIFAMYFSLPYLSFRPVTFAIVLLALCAWLLLRDRRLQEKARAVWLIVPITALTTNCHFFAVLVPMWVCALLIGAIWERRNIMRYTKMFSATAIACTATPMLSGVVRSMWNYQFADPMVSAGGVAEFQPIWAGALGPVSVCLLIGLFACVFYNRKKIRAGEWIWLFIVTALVIRLGRFAPVFAPIAAATLAACLPQLGGKVLARPAIRTTLACILAIGLVRLCSAFPKSSTSLSTWLNRNGPDTPGYPCAAADFVSQHISSGRIINEFSWGGYLSWRLGDDYPILLDGRTQLYSPQFWRTMYLGPADDSRATLQNAVAQAAVLPTSHSRFRSVLLDMGWQSAYRDDRAEVLLPPAAQAGGF
jgi:hypothetical protein